MCTIKSVSPSLKSLFKLNLINVRKGDVTKSLCMTLGDNFNK